LAQCWYDAFIPLNVLRGSARYPQWQTLRADLALYPLDETFVSTIEEAIAYQFNSPSLLLEAFTHPSFSLLFVPQGPAAQRSSSYQRLEFLGDAMLGFIVTEFLFDWSPELSPGDMTEWRALIVSNEMLGMVTARNDFSSHLRHSSQQLQRDIDRYLDLFSGLSSIDSSSSPAPPISSHRAASSTISRFLYSELNPPKALADIFEALIGAILIDSGGRVEECRKIISSLLLEPLIIPLLVDDGSDCDTGSGVGNENKRLQRHPVSVIHEIVSIFACSEVKTVFTAAVEGRSFPSLSPRISCQISCHGNVIAEGIGENNKRARLAAALSITTEERVTCRVSEIACRDW
jgi:dsRNA-specific ribonuclease